MRLPHATQPLARAAVRVVTAVLLLTLIGAILTACAGPAVPRLTADKDALDRVDGFPDSQQSKLVDEILASKNPVGLRTKLVAALNGYDMCDPTFDDAKVRVAEPVEPDAETEREWDTPNKEDAVTYALTALEQADIKKDPYQTMTAEDFQRVVDCFREKVPLERGRGVGDTILHWLGVGFGWLIRYPGFGNFILGSLYLSIVVEVLMLPLGIHQQRTSLKAARLRPKEMAVRNKYKGRNDRATQQKMMTEIQEMYSKEGYSPMSGCLPMLLSLPIMFALYWIVIDPLKNMMGCPADLSRALTTFVSAPRAAGGLGLTIRDNRSTIEALALIRESGTEQLARLKDFAFFQNGADCFDRLTELIEQTPIPNFSLFGVNMGLRPTFGKPWILLLIPVLTFAVYYGSMRIGRKLTFQPMTAEDSGSGKDPAQGCSNSMMNVMMPAMSTYFAFIVPAAVGVYWIIRSIVGTLKQFILAKAMPLPVFTEEDYKAAERELAGRDRNRPVRRSGTRNPNVRSLHHIDDEDFEPQPAGRETKPLPPPAAGEAPPAPADAVPGGKGERKGDGKPLIQQAPLKEDEGPAPRKRRAGKPEKPEKPEKAEKNGESEKTGEPERTDQPGEAGTPGKPGKPGKPGESGEEPRPTDRKG